MSPSEDHDSESHARESRTGAPNLPDRLPSYDFGRRGPAATRNLFDDQGNPLVASQREIAPDKDNPIGSFLRLGESLAWKTLGGSRVWPHNVRNNTVSHYLVGRLKG